MNTLIPLSTAGRGPPSAMTRRRNVDSNLT
jgi:hypothetical protein